MAETTQNPTFEAFETTRSAGFLPFKTWVELLGERKNLRGAVAIEVRAFRGRSGFVTIARSTIATPDGKPPEAGDEPVIDPEAHAQAAYQVAVRYAKKEAIDLFRLQVVVRPAKKGAGVAFEEDGEYANLRINPTTGETNLETDEKGKPQPWETIAKGLWTFVDRLLTANVELVTGITGLYTGAIELADRVEKRREKVAEYEERVREQGSPQEGTKRFGMAVRTASSQMTNLMRLFAMAKFGPDAASHFKDPTGDETEAAPGDAGGGVLQTRLREWWEGVSNASKDKIRDHAELGVEFFEAFNAGVYAAPEDWPEVRASLAPVILGKSDALRSCFTADEWSAIMQLAPLL